MRTTLKNIFSFKGQISRRTFLKQLFVFILIYVILMILRSTIFYFTVLYSDNLPGYSDVKYKMKPLTDGIMAWLIAFILTQIPYGLAMLALMVRRINDTKTAPIVIILLFISWLPANIVVFVLIYLVTRFDILIPTLLSVNIVFILIMMYFLTLPSKH
ncbi:hypothetical protein ACMGE5_00455 [Macrococcus equi]|uniref:hypothetical protein n=1 Tax=Macrococcus equi TaxID=3395462 RepID=UPI0039BDF594